MTDKEDQYKNLEFAANAYSMAEGAFPLWEAVFALIEGQIFIAYFSSRMHTDQKVGLAVLGFVISIIWFMLVSLNYLNAAHISKKMDKIGAILKLGSPLCAPSSQFIWPWPNETDKKEWTPRVMITGLLPGQKLDRHKLLRSTWFYRKALPFILILTWLVLVTWQIHLIRICGDRHF